MFMSCHQNSGYNLNIKIANKSLEIVAKFKYLGKRITSQTYIMMKLRAD